MGEDYIIGVQQCIEQTDLIIDEIHKKYLLRNDTETKVRLDTQIKILWHIKSSFEDFIKL